MSIPYTRLFNFLSKRMELIPLWEKILVDCHTNNNDTELVSHCVSVISGAGYITKRNVMKVLYDMPFSDYNDDYMMRYKFYSNYHSMNPASEITQLKIKDIVERVSNEFN